MRMLHHIHLPVTDRFYFHPGRFLFLTNSYCQRQLHGRLYLRYLKKEGIRPVIQFYFPGLIAQGNRCIGGGSFVFYRNPYFLYRAFRSFIQSGKEMRLDPGGAVEALQAKDDRTNNASPVRNKVLSVFISIYFLSILKEIIQI